MQSKHERYSIFVLELINKIGKVFETSRKEDLYEKKMLEIFALS